MSSQETPKSRPQEQADQPTHIDDAVRRAHQTIGELPEDMGQRKPWTKAEIDQRINDKLSRHDYKLQDVFQFKSDIDRQYMLDLLTKLEREKRQPTDAEKRELVAAQLRVTVNESMARSLDAYMELIAQYRQLKVQGLRADPVQERIVFDHMDRVQKVAQERVDWAVKNVTKSVPVAEAQQKAYECEKELLKLLACTDPSVPGGNKEGTLPVFPLMLSMLQKEYEEIMAKYKQIGTEPAGQAKTRVDEAQRVMEANFPNMSPGVINEGDIDKVLSKLSFEGKPYSIVNYKADLLAVKSRSTVFERLREEGAKNVQKLADLTVVMGRYHISRGELASVRHHFDQMYKWDGTQREVPKGSTPEKAMSDAQAWLEAQQRGSLDSIDQHLEKVDTGVLKVGIAENIENMSNEGRVFMTRLAEIVATMETAWIPDIAGFSPGQSAKEYLMGGLYDAVGWPRDSKGTPKKWSDLTEAEKKTMRDKQDSIKKSIDRFRETKALENVKTSVSAAKALINRKDLKPESFMNTEGEIDPSTLPKDVVTDKNIDELVQKHGATTVYKMCFVQLAQNWEAYGEHYGTLLKDFHNVVGVHYDMQRYWNDFANKQMSISWLLLMLAGAGLVAGGIIIGATMKSAKFVVQKGLKGTWSLAKATGRGATKLGGWGADQVGRMIKGSPKGPVTPTTAPTTAPATGPGSGQAIEKLSKAKAGVRILGHLAFIAGEAMTVYEIIQKVREIRSAEPIHDRELANTALEFWKGGKVPGIPGGMSLSEGREEFYKEEIAVLEKRVLVENLRLTLGSHTLPLPPDGLPGDVRNEGEALKTRRNELLKRQEQMLAALAQEKEWLSIELPFLDKIFTRTGQEHRPRYNVNISGEVPGIKFYGGPLDRATAAGPGNRQRHRELTTDRSAPRRYGEQFDKSGPGMGADYWHERAEELKKRQTSEQIVESYAKLHRDMEQYITDVVILEEKVTGKPGVKLHADVRQLQMSEALGGTIENPIDVSPESHPTDIVSGGKQMFLRLPQLNYQWGVVGADGKIQKVLNVNKTPENAGKLEFEGKGRLAFWLPGDKEWRFELTVR